MMPARGPKHIIRARSTTGDRQEGDWEPGGASSGRPPRPRWGRTWSTGGHACHLQTAAADPSGLAAGRPNCGPYSSATRQPRRKRMRGGELGRARGLAVASHGAHGGPPNGVPARSRSLGKTKALRKARTKTMWHSQFTAQRHISKQKAPWPNGLVANISPQLMVACQGARLDASSNSGKHLENEAEVPRVFQRASRYRVDESEGAKLILTL